MKKLFIIYPHWYPSNLAGVHRPRLTGNYVFEFGWQPVILTVKPEYFEETPDPDMYRLFSPRFKEFRTHALKISKPRIVGDIGLRSFWHLYQKAKEIIRDEKPDFLWIPIPSFYIALLGRILHKKTGIPYGIDYIDPWVRDISQDVTLRSKLSLLAAKILEPVAVKKASLLTGVAYEYYKPVIDRNFRNKKISHAAFPYGFDPNDHAIEIPDLKLPWEECKNCIPIVYAGAFMPNSQYYLECFFKAFQELVQENKVNGNIHMYFLGTGYYPHKSVAEYAKQYNLTTVVTEIRDRYPYLHILNFLSKAEKLLIIGSTEKHYTASKTYQVMLSKRPFMGIFHEESTACSVIKECNAAEYLVTWQPGEENFQSKVKSVLQKFLVSDTWNINLAPLEAHSAKASAKILVEKLDEIVDKS